jgi:hypothetical protein
MESGNETVQIESEEDGCTYVCNLSTGKWQRVCEITSIREVPEDIRIMLDTLRRSLEALYGNP